MKPLEVWAIARLVAGLDINGELPLLAEPSRSMVVCLASVPVDHALSGQALQEAKANARQPLWQAMLTACPDRDGLLKALQGVDPSKPPPAPGTLEKCATLADVRRVVSNTDWPWPDWLAAGALSALAADPGTGKTILTMDLARRLHGGEAWPDGQANPFPEESTTLWVPGDRHYGQLMHLATQYGLPDEAIWFNARASDPMSGLEMDDPAERAALESRIEMVRPQLVVIDTVGMTTGLNLCKPEDARDYFGPLMDMAQRTNVPFLLLTHLSRDGQALGRRINGACRVVWKLTEPDPEGQPDRRRFWVDKTYMQKPPPLGMTIAESGCSFDAKPPCAPEPDKGGRPSDARSKAKEYVRQKLSVRNDQIGNDLAAEWDGGSTNTFWRAVDEMVEAGTLAKDGGKGTRRQVVLHLNEQTPRADE